MTSPKSADRCASMPQVRSFSVGAAPEAGLLCGSLMTAQDYHFAVGEAAPTPLLLPDMELQPRLDAGKYSDARLQKPNWILVVPVKKIVDAPEHGPLPAEIETRRDIHRDISGRVEARDRKVTVAVHPVAHREQVQVEPQRLRHLPIRIQRALVPGTAQQLLLQQVIGRLGVGVIEAQGEPPRGLTSDEALDAVRGGTADVGPGGRGHVRRDQVADAVVVVGGADAQPVAGQALLDPGVITDAALGPQLRIGEEKKLREVLEQLA